MLYDVFVSHILLASFTCSESDIKKVSDHTSTDDSLFGKFVIQFSLNSGADLFWGNQKSKKK